MVKLRDLEYLIAIAEHKHFGRAAQSCFVSQPTLSGQVKKLESQLNLTLIERQSKKVMLTPSGEKLVVEARKVLSAAKEFEASAKSLLDPLSGDLHVGSIPTLAAYILPYVQGPLKEDFPNITFYLHESKTKDLLRDLEEGKLDILILPWLDEMDKFARFDLFSEPLVMATHPNHSLAYKNEVKLSDLENQDILSLEDGHCLRDQSLGYCFASGANEDPRFKAASLEILRYMVASEMGITLFPQLATLNLVSNNAVTYIPFENPKPVRQISLVTRQGYSRMEVVEAVVTTIKTSISRVFIDD
jgi:LysR family hydrogen peroxide-inducible transcriptional activator